MGTHKEEGETRKKVTVRTNQEKSTLKPKVTIPRCRKHQSCQRGWLPRHSFGGKYSLSCGPQQKKGTLIRAIFEIGGRSMGMEASRIMHPLSPFSVGVATVSGEPTPPSLDPEPSHESICAAQQAPTTNSRTFVCLKHNPCPCRHRALAYAASCTSAKKQNCLLARRTQCP